MIDAILLGALYIHNVQPGPSLYRHNPELVNAIIATALVANFVMLAIMLGGTRYIARLLNVPKSYLLPVVLMFCILGSFALGNRWFDVWVMLAFSVIGFVLERGSIPLGPFVIGLVLEPIAEESLRSGLMYTAGSIVPLFTTPVSLIFILIALGTLVWPLIRQVRNKRARLRYSGKPG